MSGCNVCYIPIFWCVRLVVNHIWIKLADVLIEDGDEQNLEIIAYGLSKISSLLFDLTITVILGLSLGVLPEGIIFNIPYIGLRMSAGGYHASKKGLCLLESCALTIGSLYLIKILSYRSVFIGAILCCLFLICFFSPVEARSKPLSEKEKKVCKSRTVWISFAIAVFLLTDAIFLHYEKGIVAVLVAVLDVLVLEIMGKAENYFRRNTLME